MEVVVGLDGRWRRRVRRVTPGLAAFNEIIIWNLQAMNLPRECGFTAAYVRHMEARQLEEWEDKDEGLLNHILDE